MVGGFKLENVDAYKRSFALSNYVWEIVTHWGILAQKTIGEQFVKAIDSISANIAEGVGRYFKKDKIKFFYYSKGSLFESSDWCKKAYVRKLLSDKQQTYILNELRKLPKEINYLIKSTRENLAI